MVGQACFCAWLSVRTQARGCGSGTEFGLGVWPSLLLAWVAFALAGDCRYRAWMVLVKCAALVLYGLSGALLLAFGGQPRGQAFALAVTALWIAFVFAQPRPEPSLGSAPDDPAARQT